MLKQRLITAAILLPLVVWAILELPTVYVALLFALVVSQGGWEWGGLMRQSSRRQRGAFVITVVAALAGAGWLFQSAGLHWLALPILSLFWWLLAAVWVLSYPASDQRWSNAAIQWLIGLAILLPTWVAIIGLHHSGSQGPYLVLYLLSLIWVADSGAYFGGRKWGKRKLAPAVSPGKTWAGVVSALAASAIYAGLAVDFFSLPRNLWTAFVVLSLVTVIFSILGDLTESMFKRQAGIKDSGGLLPGHGGVLDRIDSVTAAAPVFVVGFWLSGLMEINAA